MHIGAYSLCACTKLKCRQSHAHGVHAQSRVTRSPEACPTCGGPARAASYRGEKPAKSKSAPYRAIGRNYCPTCDKLLPREK